MFLAVSVALLVKVAAAAAAAVAAAAVQLPGLVLLLLLLLLLPLLMLLLAQHRKSSMLPAPHSPVIVTCKNRNWSPLCVLQRRLRTPACISVSLQQHNR